MDATPEAIRLSNSRMQEETDDGAEAVRRGNSSEACLSLVSTGVCERNRGIKCRRERTRVVMNGWMGGSLFLFKSYYISFIAEAEGRSSRHEQ